jgi:uncharacterized protein YneF (UPF0154 family)
VGAAVWAGAAVALGMVFHKQVDSVLQWLSEKGAMAILIVGIAAGLYIAHKWVARYLFIRAMRMARIRVDELRALRQSNTPLLILDARSSTGHNQMWVKKNPWFEREELPALKKRVQALL